MKLKDLILVLPIGTDKIDCWNRDETLVVTLQDQLHTISEFYYECGVLKVSAHYCEYDKSAVIDVLLDVDY